MNQHRWDWLRQRRSTDIAALLVIVIFFIVFFRTAIFGGKFFVIGDSITYNYPLRVVAWEMIRHGSLPLWTPYVLSGYPMLSMAMIAILYPLTWGHLFLPGYWSEQIFILAPYLLAPVFTYTYAREIGRSPLASLLAGLSFGYGGMMFSPVGFYGNFTNSMMWLPLMLMAVERARKHSFISCLLFATVVFTLSVLTGVGQMFTYLGLLALAYAVFLVSTKSLNERDLKWTDWERWKPVAVAIGAVALTVGLTAFQILETLRAASFSVRHQLTYENFSEGSFEFAKAWRSVLDPLHNVVDVTTYVPPLALLFSAAALLLVWRDRREDPRILFWFAAAIISFTLILGSNTPLNHLIYRIPFINRFRVPSRHSFEWTFALSMMAASGWDATQALLAKRWNQDFTRRQWLNIGLGLLCFLVVAFIGIRWWFDLRTVEPDFLSLFGHLSPGYLKWKIAFTLPALLAVWLGWRITPRLWQFSILALTIALACFIEPFICLARWIEPFSVTKERFNYFAPITQLVQQSPPEQNRYFAKINLSGDHSPRPLIDTPNWPAIAGLHNVQGYEPLIPERYSRALSSSDWNSVNHAPYVPPDRSLLEPQSHVLDLLNVTFVATYSNLAADPGQMIKKDQILLAGQDSPMNLSDKDAAVLASDGAEADVIALVTTLANSGNVTDSTPVAQISVHTTDGRIINRDLRAGDDTAEWAHERADVKPNVRHRLAPIFDGRPGDQANSFLSYRYWARLNIGERVKVQHVEMKRLFPNVDVVIWRSTLYDSTTGHSIPFTSLDRTRWETAYQDDNVTLLHNRRALPRTWLVTEAQAVNQTEAWQMIRGQGERPFDPRRTALLELEQDQMPALTGRPLSPNAYARIIEYQANRLGIETNADQQTVLIVSEMNYPGWVAKIDGAQTPIHQTDFLLRGIIVPAGKHLVEMNYQAPSARNGAIISLLTIALVGGMTIYARRKSSRGSKRYDDSLASV